MKNEKSSVYSTDVIGSLVNFPAPEEKKGKCDVMTSRKKGGRKGNKNKKGEMEGYGDRKMQGIK
jgi:hypothetical protein